MSIPPRILKVCFLTPNSSIGNPETRTRTRYQTPPLTIFQSLVSTQNPMRRITDTFKSRSQDLVKPHTKVACLMQSSTSLRSTPWSPLKSSSELRSSTPTLTSQVRIYLLFFLLSHSFIGRICLDILKDKWSPALQIRAVSYFTLTPRFSYQFKP